jgi:hypothetical protein
MIKRDATQTIWRTVVFAGAMLGAPACSKKPAPAAPSTTQPAATDGVPGDPASATPPDSGDPCGDPCAGMARPRGDDEGGGMGRGFVLS